MSRNFPYTDAGFPVISKLVAWEYLSARILYEDIHVLYLLCVVSFLFLFVIVCRVELTYIESDVARQRVVAVFNGLHRIVFLCNVIVLAPSETIRSTLAMGCGKLHQG